jgi:two-component system sensor histidine kinase UhpB
LNNAAKHAHATRVEVVLKADAGEVLMVIDDDGIGFDAFNWTPGSDGIGLASMRERAALINATLEIESAPGRGTSVYLRAPVVAQPAGGRS